jgi:predicted 3-demethylubiquinone-9 3-methyltransferase (glyoxalase superfamily)
MTDDGNSRMTTSVTPFLMFQGDASAALDFYQAVFPDVEIIALERYGPGDGAQAGWIKMATVRIGGQILRCNDSPIRHAFTFTPSFSLFVECDSEERLEQLFGALAEGGGTLMPLDNYGFSRRFGWVNDRFGVSWQLNFA